MNDREAQQEIEDRVRRALDERAAGLDAATLSRLRQAREQALARGGRRSWWQRWPAGGGLRWASALAAGLLLVVGLVVWQQAGRQGLDGAVDDLEVLASSDDLKLYQDLDFYLWLEREGLPANGAEDRT